jgi:hypothetical protein
VATTSDRKHNTSTLTISGIEVRVTHERVSIGDLKVDPNNPRIRLQIKYGAKKKPETQDCRRRSKSDPPRRSNIDPGMDADRVMVGCGQV